jgi:hypothetical protein
MKEDLFVTINRKRYLRMSTTITLGRIEILREEYKNRGILIRAVESFHQGFLFHNSYFIVECLVPLNQIEWFGELN